MSIINTNKKDHKACLYYFRGKEFKDWPSPITSTALARVFSNFKKNIESTLQVTRPITVDSSLRILEELIVSQ